MRPAATARGTVKGMFLNFVLDFAHAQGARNVVHPRWIPFKSYPVSEHNALVDEVVQAVLPAATTAEAHRILGAEIYARFRETMVGTALLAAAGSDWNRVILVGPKAYEVSITPGSVEVELLRPGSAVVKLRDIWAYVDTLQLGIWEAAMKRCGAEGTIEVLGISRCDADFLVEWRT